MWTFGSLTLVDWAGALAFVGCWLLLFDVESVESANALEAYVNSSNSAHVLGFPLRDGTGSRAWQLFCDICGPQRSDFWVFKDCAPPPLARHCRGNLYNRNDDANSTAICA